MPHCQVVGVWSRAWALVLWVVLPSRWLVQFVAWHSLACDEWTWVCNTIHNSQWKRRWSSASWTRHLQHATSLSCTARAAGLGCGSRTMGVLTEKDSRTPGLYGWYVCWTLMWFMKNLKFFLHRPRVGCFYFECFKTLFESRCQSDFSLEFNKC